MAAKAFLPLIVKRWEFVWEQQQFILDRPSLHETSIKNAMDLESASSERKLIGVLMSILPTLGIGNICEV